MDGEEVDVLARTAWAEARGEGRAGMSAVINVIQNRARNPRWWGGPSFSSVCKKPWQFSCWNPGDPNRAKLLTVTTKDQQFAEAYELAELAAKGSLPDATEHADHYHERSISPQWASGKTPVAIIGRHHFHRLELSPPRTEPEPPRPTKPQPTKPPEKGNTGFQPRAVVSKRRRQSH